MKLRTRKTTTGSTVFFLDDYHNGVRIRESVGVTVPKGTSALAFKAAKARAELAYEIMAKELLLARKGLVRDDSISLVSFAESLTVNRDKQDHVVRVIPYLREHFGRQELRSVDYRACDSFQAYLSTSATSAKTGDGLSPKTVRHYFNALAFVLNEAVRDRFLERSPATSVRRVKVPDKIVIALTADELHALWQVPIRGTLGAAVREAFFVSANTGLRLGDLRSLCWGDIQTGANGWKLTKAQDKTGTRILVPLNANVHEILANRFNLSPSAPVFPELQTAANIARYVPPWAKAAGVQKKVTFHTARHTFGTLLAEAGGDAMLIQGLMGHTTRAMTEHYTQAAGREARGLVGALPRLVSVQK